MTSLQKPDDVKAFIRSGHTSRTDKHTQTDRTRTRAHARATPVYTLKARI